MNLPSIAFPFLQPFLLRLNPERAHDFTIALLRLWRPLAQPSPPALLKCRAFGLNFPSPIGLAAGFDKNGHVANKMPHLGFGFAEIGTMTPMPQKGNPQPRLFRRAQEKAIINHLGFNNQGLNAIIARWVKQQKNKTGIIGINIGANAKSRDRIADYVSAAQQIETMTPPPDYITINVSSPNTENLRQFESVQHLARLLDRLKTSRPLLVKLSPDMDDTAYADIAQLAIEKNISGLIAVNTTIKHSHKQKGGLSGPPLAARALHITSLLHQAAKGKLPIISAGGITSGEDAYRRIKAGAHLVQLYTALIWHGPALIARMNHSLAACLLRDGFSSLADAIGSAHNHP